MRPETEDLRPAIIISDWRENLWIVRDSEGRKYGFDVSMVEGYRGQDPEELGLKNGRAVEIRTDGNRIISVKAS